jgi:hypothetical protein
MKDKIVDNLFVFGFLAFMIWLTMFHSSNEFLSVMSWIIVFANIGVVTLCIELDKWVDIKIKDKKSKR